MLKDTKNGMGAKAAKAKLSGQVPAAPQRISKHFIRHDFDSRPWVQDVIDLSEDQAVAEWLVKGQSQTDWTEKLTAAISYREADVHSLVRFIERRLGEKCPDFRSRILSDRPGDITFEWSHNGCDDDPPQRETRRIMAGIDGTYSISYTARPGGYERELYQQWVDIILGADLLNRK